MQTELEQYIDLGIVNERKIENELSYKIIGAAIEVHKILGPGLLESIYEEALCHELELLGMQVQRQVSVQVVYKGITIKKSLFIDILVNGKVVIEVKATEKNVTIFESQLLTYLRLTRLKLGLLINFGYNQIKEGMCRVVNGL